MLFCIGVEFTEFIKKNYLEAFDIFTKYNELMDFFSFNLLFGSHLS